MVAYIKGLPCLKLILFGLLLSTFLNGVFAQPLSSRSRRPSPWRPRPGMGRRLSPGLRSLRQRTIRVRNPRIEELSMPTIRSFRPETSFAGRMRRPSLPLSFRPPRLSEVRVPGVQRSPISRREPTRRPIEIVQRQRQMIGRQMFNDVIPQLPSNRQPNIINDAFPRSLRRGPAIFPLNADFQNELRLSNNNNNDNSRLSTFPGLPQFSFPQEPLQPRFRVQQRPASRSTPQRSRLSRMGSFKNRISEVRPSIDGTRERFFQSRDLASRPLQRQPEIVVTRQQQTALVTNHQTKQIPVSRSQLAPSRHIQRQPLVLARKPSIQSLPKQSQLVVTKSQPQLTLSQQMIPLQTSVSQQTNLGDSVQLQTPNSQIAQMQGQQIIVQGHIPNTGALSSGTVAVSQVPVQGAPAIGNGLSQPVVISNGMTSSASSTHQEGPVQVVSLQPASTVTGGTGNADPLFEELVNAFTDVLQNPGGQQQVVVQSAPTVPHLVQHPQTVIQSPLQLPLQPVIQQHGGMMHHGGMMPVGAQMAGNPFGFMNPWMMGGMNSAMMQEMMFGDTTDPPDPVATTTTTAAPTVAAPVPATGKQKPSAGVNSTSIVVSSIDGAVKSSSGTLVTADVIKAGVHPEVVHVIPNTGAKSEVITVVKKADSNKIGIKTEVVPSIESADSSNLKINSVLVKSGVKTPGTPQETAPVVTKLVTTADVSPVAMDTAKADVTNTGTETLIVNIPTVANPENQKLTSTTLDKSSGVNLATGNTKTMSSLSLEEKIFAEVAAMLPSNNNVDMSLLSKVLGHVATELKSAPVESIPSAIQLGLKSLVPDPNAKKLTKKEIVEKLKGSTRGVVVYPPTPPTVAKSSAPKYVVPATTNDTKVIDIKAVSVKPPKRLSPVVTVLTQNPRLSMTTQVPPRVEIPTLPPNTGSVDVQPEVYRTLQTILDHNPAAVVEVLSDNVTPLPKAPKLSVKSLVDTDPKSNLPNLQTILTEISTGPREVTKIVKINASTSKPETPVLNIETLPGDLVSLKKTNDSHANASVEPTLQELKLQPLVDAVTPSTKYHTFDAVLSNSPTVPSITDTQFASVSSASADPTSLPTDLNPSVTEAVGTFIDPITTPASWTAPTFAPIVETSTNAIANVTESIPKEGVPVNISHESLVMANMEGVPVNIEKVLNAYPTQVTDSQHTVNNHVTTTSPVNIDATGALAILQEIKSFKPGNVSSKQTELAKKLSDPNFVNVLRGLLKDLMAKASVTTPGSTPTEATYSDLSTVTIFSDVSTSALPVSTTEEYEAEDFIFPSSTTTASPA